MVQCRALDNWNRVVQGFYTTSTGLRGFGIFGAEDGIFKPRCLGFWGLYIRYKLMTPGLQNEITAY